MATPYLPESPPLMSSRGTPLTLHALHSHFLAILPRIQNHAQIRFRHVRCPGKRDDAIAEVIALCWQWFLRLVEQNRDVDQFVMTLADYAVRHVRSGRRLCGQERSNDVLSSLAQQRRGFKVEALASSTLRTYEDLLSDPHGQERVDAMEERLRDNCQSPVPDQAAFRIDFSTWLISIDQRKRAIVEDMTLDLVTGELAAKHEVSQGRISQMRREFHASWQRFHGEVC